MILVVPSCGKGRKSEGSEGSEGSAALREPGCRADRGRDSDCVVILVAPICARGETGKARRVPNYPEGAKLQKGRIQRVL